MRLEVQRQEVEALHRPVDVDRDMASGAGLLDRLSDARVLPLHGRRRRARLRGLPLAQVPHVRVLGEQERECGRAGAGQAEPEERCLDRDVVDLRMPPVPLLDLEALSQVAHDPRVQERLAARVQPRLLAQRPHEDLQALPERIVTEVLEAGLRDGCGQQVLVCCHPPPPERDLRSNLFIMRAGRQATALARTGVGHGTLAQTAGR